MSRPVLLLPTRRLRSAGATPVATSTQPAVQSSAPKIGFHRRLQETTLARALALRGQVEKLDTEWKELNDEWAALLEDRIQHREDQAAALKRINDTIATSTTLSNISRQLSTDAVQISHDVRILMNRHAALILGIMNIDDHAERDAAVLGIEGTTPELLAGDMFVSLFDGIRFDDLDGASEQWEELVKEAPPDSNSAQIALSWDQIFGAFVTLVPVVGLSKVAEAHLVRHRTCLSDMMRPAAACQLAKMRDIDRRLAELSDQAQSMREENQYNSRRYTEIEEGEERCLAGLQQLTQARPATRERYEDHLLQLVILARAQ